MKEPGIAAVLNIIPGLGYLYIGSRRIFGSLLLLGVVLFFAITFFGPADNTSASNWDNVALVNLVVLEAAFILDAAQEAERFNRTKTKFKRAK